MPETKTDLYQLSRWSLADLFPGHESKEMKTALKKLDAEIAAFEKLRKKLKKTIGKKDFLTILDKLEAQTRLAVKIDQFAGLWYSEDTQNQEAQTFQSGIEQR